MESTSITGESLARPDMNDVPESASGSSVTQRKRLSLPPRANPTTRHAKRLTLNFPINLNLNETESGTSPASATTATQSSTGPPSAQPPGTPMSFDVPDDGYDFLRAIASQERKVMELREELNRAEAELVTIKKQWALSEKSRKRAEINHAEPMMALRSPDASTSETFSAHHREQSMTSVGSSTVSQERASRELGRRTSIRAPPAPGTKIGTNGRRVFQGGHTRTLSLLSPVTASSAFVGEPGPSETDRVGRTPRSATLPSVERDHAAIARMDESQVPEHLLAQWHKTLPPPSREALMRTGKQMASDLREGLWTFLEDIRQATVGEEGINGTQTRTMSPSNSLAPPNGQNGRKRDSLAKSRSRERLLADGKLSRSSSSSSSRGGGPAAETKTGKDTKPAEISTSFWSEFGIDTPAQKSPNAPRTPNQSASRSEATDEQRDRHSSNQAEPQNDDLDDWGSWETPLSAHKMHTPSSSRSTVESKHDHSPTTQSSSPRTSASFGDWNPDSTSLDPSVSEGIPWPAITKLAPSKLQRTASNLMAEWERSLSPSPERVSLTRKDSKKD
ncbi:unnamed protein product [Penicillium salamii]|uniref:DUF4048 domain-containing protein n=1 Tax=Penicillium salamii TaxID=1612424 RepID=A0A9W4N2C0_9EURO|nr:unnamed protein product [Penicillium salamii]CAG7963054.1 unnamed protein product [Penicillium salamii]CAG7966534.1 unnamed protein product [Penicillium salamii]CAG7984263.1 unnamed protein product [Penicillium salamii]CAG8124243.1 unnamed protein product [Penicillium salamii]